MFHRGGFEFKIVTKKKTKVDWVGLLCYNIKVFFMIVEKKEL
jgi:hypothetical protein